MPAQRAPSDQRQQQSGSAAHAAPREEPPAPPVTSSTVVTPHDYDKRIENWDESWQFRQPDEGTVDFDVTKDSGLIVCISTVSGYPQDGYAVLIDQRGQGDTDPFDDNTSVSYISRVPNLNGPISAHANARGVELSRTRSSHITIHYRAGYVEVLRNGVKFLQTRDMTATPGVQYVGFGHTGVRSGVGHIKNIVIT